MKRMKPEQRRLIVVQEIGYLVLELSKYAIEKIPTVEWGTDWGITNSMSNKNYLRIKQQDLAVAEDGVLVLLVRSYNHPDDVGIGKTRRTKMQNILIDSLSNQVAMDILLSLLEVRRRILLTS